MREERLVRHGVYLDGVQQCDRRVEGQAQLRFGWSGKRVKRGCTPGGGGGSRSYPWWPTISGPSAKGSFCPDKIRGNWFKLRSRGDWFRRLAVGKQNVVCHGSRPFVFLVPRAFQLQEIRAAQRETSLPEDMRVTAAKATRKQVVRVEQWCPTTRTRNRQDATTNFCSDEGTGCERSRNILKSRCE